MNKTQLVNAVAEKAGLKKKDAEAALAAVISSIEDALADGDKIQLIGFGTFGVKERAERTGRNPSTGKAIVIPATKVVSFSPSSNLKTKVNG